MNLSKLIRNITLLFAFLFIAQQPVLASPSNAEALDLVKSTSDKVLAAIKKDPTNAFNVAKSFVLPYFDFVAMSRLVIGRNWNSASAAHQNEFVEAFKELLIRTYANTMNEAAGTVSDVQILPIRDKDGSDRITVQTIVKYGNNQSLRVDYSLRHRQDDWKVYDVSAAGISLVTNYRAEFQELYTRSGMAGLIEEIKRKNKG